MIVVKTKSDCCGCTACASICNRDAITMTSDALGFKYPVVDLKKCVNCGLCEKVCQFNENYDTSLNMKAPIAFGARQKSIDEVMKSRSGGVFAALSDFVLEKGGIVYGAGFDDEFKVVHKRAATKTDCDQFRGSKYVQSDMSNIFRQIKSDLYNEKTVLFSGTPCQNAGLNSFIGKKLREKLILIDIVCDGVPSPKFYEDYIKNAEKVQSSKLRSIDFRDKKKYGWKDHKETLMFENGSCSAYHYAYFFYTRLLTRPSCGVCKYTNLKRPSDITLADFWGYESSCNEINPDNKGCSLVLANTEKGLTLFNSIVDRLNKKEVLLDQIMQPNFIHTHPLNSKSGEFEKDYENRGFDFVVRKYGNTSFSFKLGKFFKRAVGKIRKVF